MEHAIIIGVLGFFQAVSVAVIGGLFARNSRKQKETYANTERSSKLRAKESLMSMKLMAANNSLAQVMARAIRDGKTNGEMEEALVGAEKAQREYYEFINNIASEHMAAD